MRNALSPLIFSYCGQDITQLFSTSRSPRHSSRNLSCGALKVAQKFTDSGSSSLPFCTQPDCDRGTCSQSASSGQSKGGKRHKPCETCQRCTGITLVERCFCLCTPTFRGPKKLSISGPLTEKSHEQRASSIYRTHNVCPVHVRKRHRKRKIAKSWNKSHQIVRCTLPPSSFLS